MARVLVPVLLSLLFLASPAGAVDVHRLQSTMEHLARERSEAAERRGSLMDRIERLAASLERRQRSAGERERAELERERDRLGDLRREADKLSGLIADLSDKIRRIEHDIEVARKH